MAGPVRPDGLPVGFLVGYGIVKRLPDEVDNSPGAFLYSDGRGNRTARAKPVWVDMT